MLTQPRCLPSLKQVPQPQPRVAGTRDPALDGLRGIAILLVFFFHYGGGLRAPSPLLRVAGYLAQGGWVGVELFFVLSGFLITGLLLDAPNNLSGFYTRRALRILPLYWIALLLCAGAALIDGARAVQLRPLLFYLGFLQNLPRLVIPALHTPPPLPVFHLWSLAVEEQFYLLWPVLILVLRRPRRVLWLCLSLFLMSSVLRWQLFSPWRMIHADALSVATSLPVRIGGLALGGAWAAYGRFENTRPVATFAGGLALCAAGVFLLQGWLAGSWLLAGPVSFRVGLPAADLVCAAALALAMEQSGWRALLATPALALLGRISYGFYVFHILLEPVFDVLGRLLTHAAAGFFYQGVRLIIAFCLTLVVARLSFRWVEQPFLGLKRHFPYRE